MSRGKGYSDLLVAQYADGTALNTSTVETSIIHPAAKITLPANYFDQPGKSFRVRAIGRISNIATTPGTLTLRLKFGSIAVWDSGAIALNVNVKTNVTWRLDLFATVQVLGQTTVAKLMPIGQLCTESAAGAAAGVPPDIFLPASAPVQGGGFDSTAAQAVDLTGQWSISNAGNSIQTHLYYVEALN